MTDFIERRDYPRMILESTARFTLEGEADSQETFIKDLSSSGMLLVSNDAIAIDTLLLVTITPFSDITPPLNAEVVVLRCDPLEEDGETKFTIACLVKRFEERKLKRA